MEISGVIKVINPEQQVSASFKKRELVITTDEQYAQHILIEFHQDKCDFLNQYIEGEEVKISINLRGRMWTNPKGEDKYFNTIQGWNITRSQSDNQAQPASQNESMVDVYMDKRAEDIEIEDDSDLPF